MPDIEGRQTFKRDTTQTLSDLESEENGSAKRQKVEPEAVVQHEKIEPDAAAVQATEPFPAFDPAHFNPDYAVAPARKSIFGPFPIEEVKNEKDA